MSTRGPGYLLFTLVKGLVLLVLLLLTFAGGACVLGGGFGGLALVGAIAVLVFGWPAWLLLKSFLPGPKEASREAGGPPDGDKTKDPQ